MKVLYGDDEWALIVQAAQMLGLRPAATSRQRRCPRRNSPSTRRRRAGPAVVASAAPATDRELLLELMQARTAVNRYGVNVNQAVAACTAWGRRLSGLSRPSSARAGRSNGSTRRPPWWHDG